MKLTLVIHREADGFVAQCPEFEIASQGTTVGEARENLIEAVQAFLGSASAQEIRHRQAAEIYVGSLEIGNAPSPKTGTGVASDRNQLREIIEGLINNWCERRALGPLRNILLAWPMPNGFTDEWHALRDRLRHIRAMSGTTLPHAESSSINAAIAIVDGALFGKQ